ncbi:MAG: aldo/keto reductase [Streptomycetaceae bacterium]|nr:aldo/keto reductase [Streptomycetaceae bacterium]
MQALDLTPRYLCRGVITYPLGVHCGAVGSNPPDGEILDGLRRAVECGATLLDTADWYGCGRAERLIGRLLRERSDQPLLLSSKVGRLQGSAPHPYADRHIHHQFEQSLENLYAEHLDLYFLDSFDFGQGDRYLGGAIDQMVTLRELGLVKAIGMRGPYTDYGSSSAERQVIAERFLYLFRLIRPNVVWMRFDPLIPAVQIDGENLFDFTRRHRLGLVLAAPQVPGAPIRSFATRSLEAIASELRFLREHFGDPPGMLTRLALRSCLQRADHCAAVFGLASGAQVEENFACLGAPLTDAELTVIDEIYARIRDRLHEAAHRPIQVEA